MIRSVGLVSLHFHMEGDGEMIRRFGKFWPYGALVLSVLLVFLILNKIITAKQHREELIKEQVFVSKIDNVTRVLMHEPKHYTFIYEDSHGIHEISWYTGNIKYIRIPLSQPMQVVAKSHYEPSSPYGQLAYDLEIYIHSSQDVNGAGWNHGKFGHGQTQVIE